VDDANIPYDDYYNSPRYSYVRFETIRDNWREGMGLLFTTLAYPRLEGKDVAIALSEEIDLSRRGQEKPASVARSLYTKTLTNGGPLSRPINGTPISLTPIKPEDLKAFHALYFSPDQLIVSVVSNVPALDVIALVRQTFGALPQGPGAPRVEPLKAGEARHRPSRLADPPVTEAPQRVEARTGKEQSQIMMGRIFARDAQDLAPLIVATTVLSQSIGRELRETRGLAYSVGCTMEDFGGEGWFTASMGTRPENIEVAEAAIRDAIRKFPDSSVAEPEIQRAVNSMRGQIAMRRMTRISQAYALAFNELLGRDLNFDAQLDAAIALVTADDVRRVARRYLDPDKMVTAVAR
jgi:zinc protease